MDCEAVSDLSDMDSIYASESPEPQAQAQVASTSAEKLQPARTHASRVSKTQTSLKIKNNHSVSRPRIPPRPRRPTSSGTEARVRDWIVRDMGGKCPPFNDKPTWLHDVANQRLYMYGGLAQGDESEIPTSEFYVCDTTTMEWKDITNSLKFRDVYNPFSRDRDATPLPQLTEPGRAIVSINNASFLFIFGGYDIETDTASSRIIVVNPERLEWWYLRLEGGDVEPRIEPAVVSVNNKLFIFGGYRRLGQDDPQPFNSYSVAEFQQDQQWHWTIRDQPYSNVVPQGLCFARAVPVYNGAKLLLTPGRVSRNRVQFTEDNFFFYHIAKKTFQLAYITGDFPPEVLWYVLVPETLPTTCTGAGMPSPARRGRPRKAPPNTPSTSNTTLPVTHPSSSLFSPPVIICAWIPIENEEAAPELWQVFLTPEERVDRLNISQKVSDLNLDFRWCVFIDGKIRLLGYDDGRGSDTATTPTMKGKEDGSEVDTDSDASMDPNAKWNIFVDVPVSNGR